MSTVFCGPPRCWSGRRRALGRSTDVPGRDGAAADPRRDDVSRVASRRIGHPEFLALIMIRTARPTITLGILLACASLSLSATACVM